MSGNDNLVAYPIIYRQSNVWKVLITIFAPLMISLFLWFAIPTDENLKDGMVYFLFWLPAGIIIPLFFTYALIAIYKSRLEIHNDRIRDVGIFKKKDLVFDDILGYRIISSQYSSAIKFIAKSSKKKDISVALILKDNKRLLEWSKEKFIDLDVENRERELQNVRNNKKFGITELQRMEALKRAKRLTLVINVVGGMVCWWGILCPYPYRPLIFSLILFPIVSIFAMYLSGGLVIFDDAQKSALPSTVYGFYMPIIALSLRAYLDWSILDWNAFWMPFVVISVVLIIVVFKIAIHNVRKQAITVVALGIFCIVWSYALTITLNGTLDSSVSTTYAGTIADKHVSNDRKPEYYLNVYIVSPWGPRYFYDDVSVPVNVYNKYNIKDVIEIDLFRGALNIPWYIIRYKE